MHVDVHMLDLVLSFTKQGQAYAHLQGSPGSFNRNFQDFLSPQMLAGTTDL